MNYHMDNDLSGNNAYSFKKKGDMMAGNNITKNKLKFQRFHCLLHTTIGYTLMHTYQYQNNKKHKHMY